MTMGAPKHDSERKWLQTERPSDLKRKGWNIAELALDALDMILDILDAIF